MIGEGDDVAVEAETDSEMLNGRRYNNRYHFVFRLRDGKFCEVREYSCSHLAQNCFNAIEPDEPEKTHMAVYRSVVRERASSILVVRHLAPQPLIRTENRHGRTK